VSDGRIGLIGLGQMGEAMGARLAQAGRRLSVNDTRPEALADFCGRYPGAAAEAPAPMAARCEVLITMLPTGEIVRRALSEPQDGVSAADAMRPGQIVVDMGSSAPHETLALGEMLAARGVSLVDAPVSGGVSRARDGTLAIMAGGECAIIDRLEEILLTMGETVLRTGTLGSGHAAKALNNAVSAAGLLAACEALIVGKRFGVEPPVLLEILNASTGRNNATEKKIEQFVLSGSYASGFALDLMVKDLRTADDLARRVGAPAPIAELAWRLSDDARSWLDHPADHTEVAAYLEHVAATSLVGAVSPEGGGHD
jgi:3-hydroxyisobutyrate dehydrogenase